MLAWKHWKTKFFLPLINNRFLIIISEYHIGIGIVQQVNQKQKIRYFILQVFTISGKIKEVNFRNREVSLQKRPMIL